MGQADIGLEIGLIVIGNLLLGRTYYYYYYHYQSEIESNLCRVL